MKKTLYYLAFLLCLVPSLGLTAQKDKVTEGIYDMGGRKLIDRSVEVTGALQVDKWLELINESTPSTPASTHARFFYNNAQEKLCVVFGDGTQSCLGPGTSGGGGVFSGVTAPILYNSTTNVISFSQTVGQNETFTSSVTVTNLLDITTTTVRSYMDFASIADPSRPTTGMVRLHGIVNNGITRLEQDNPVSITDVILSRDIVFIVKNNSGQTVNPEQVVYINGSSGNVPTVDAAISSTTTRLPAACVVVDTAAVNGFFQCMRMGIITSINTSAFNTGDMLYVSATSSGQLTNVRPAYPNYTQNIGTVLVSGIGNGSILVMVRPVQGQENGTDQAVWHGNNITVTSATVNGNAGITGQINQPLTITSSVTLLGVNLLDDNGVIQSSGGFQALNQKSVAFFAPNSVNNITLQAPNSVTSYNMQLPSAQGVANSLLQNDGTGALTWASSNTVRGYISATQPIYYNSATGVISENAVSLSTGVVGILPEANTLHTFASSITVNNTFQTNTDSTSILYVSNSVHTLPANTVDIGASGSAAHIIWADQITLGTGTVQISQDFNNGTNTYSVTWPPAQGAAQSLLSNNGIGALSWTNGPTFTSSVTVQSPSGLYTTYGASLGSATLRNVASGTQCLHADASGNVTGTGSDCNAGAGTLTSTQTWTGTNTFANAVVITSNSVVTSSTNACGYLIGTMVQVVTSTSAADFSTTSSTFMITNLTKAITPKCATDGIQISATGEMWISAISDDAYVTLMKNDLNMAGSSTGLCHNGHNIDTSGLYHGNCAISWYDTPNTTSAITYQIGVRTGGAGTAHFGDTPNQILILQEYAR